MDKLRRFFVRSSFPFCPPGWGRGHLFLSLVKEKNTKEAFPLRRGRGRYFSCFCKKSIQKNRPKGTRLQMSGSLWNPSAKISVTGLGGMGRMLESPPATNTGLRPWFKQNLHAAFSFEIQKKPMQSPTSVGLHRKGNAAE